MGMGGMRWADLGMVRCGPTEHVLRHEYYSVFTVSLLEIDYSAHPAIGASAPDPVVQVVCARV